jgi:penicillin amidase
MIVDMSVSPAEMWAIDAGSESGHPGSPHYGDQLNEWLAGHHHRVPLDRARTEAQARDRLVLTPTPSSAR